MSTLPPALARLSPEALAIALELIAEAGELREREGLAPLEAYDVRRAAQCAQDWVRMGEAVQAADSVLERRLRLSIREAEQVLFEPRRPTAAQLKAQAEKDEPAPEPEASPFDRLSERRLRAVK